MAEFLDNYGWFSLGMLLLIAEVIIPGIFLMWFGLAALFTGVIDWLIPGLSWQIQALAFAVLSVGLVFGVRPYIGLELNKETDRPDLNRRLYSLIGEVTTLTRPIQNGHGEVKIGDTLWRVTGPDLPKGTRVKVVGVDEKRMTLSVEPA
ncbi:NfeD family protein [Thermopetrobacter sp. TC1]|uniref:NfeD family protein n=1 Tax=Thermopetrobacter sp. TC1 TaxID=1495045 RepID=UPI000570997A|nr:NfeD family protein [Thermopetrobacter sp. TC1]